MGMTTVTSPVALWRALCSDAGLELRLKSGRPGRDADIEVGLRKALRVPDTEKSLEAWLASDASAGQPQVTTEIFLVALLKEQAGFARMMQDILTILVAANAHHVTHSLSIAFKFEDMHDPVVQTLEQFRESVSRTQRLLESRPMLPDSKTMWDIWGALRALGQGKGQSSRPIDFPGVPPVLPSGDPELDKQLLQTALLVVDVQELWKGYGTDRTQVTATAATLSVPAHEVNKLQRQLYAASDFWDCGVIDELKAIPTLVASGQLAPQDAYDELAEALSPLDWGDAWVERTVRELLDILALPAWQRRHELYSVWVGTRLLEVAREAEPNLRFNLVGGMLSFAFGGSRLATYERQGKEYEIWAELRSTLVGSSTKRKKGIQPDFRVLRTGLSPVGDRTVYVLECKHYLRSNATNFTTAAKDYARSCPNAVVHVVNHGPADDVALRAALPSELQSAVRFIGDANVDHEVETSTLHDAIRNVLFPIVAAPKPDGVLSDSGAAPLLPAGCVGQIFLEWDSSLQDMDLALLVIGANGSATQSIDFSHTGTLDGPPFARLDADVRQGPGVERIDIGSWHFDRYKLVAINYSRHGAMTSEALRCRIVTSAGSTLLRYPLEISLSQPEWRIAELIVRGANIDIMPIDSLR